MPPPNPPRRRPADDDFEIVDEVPPAPRPRPLPPLPGEATAAPPPAPRPAAKPAPKPAPPVAKPAPKPAFEVVATAEVEALPPTKTPPARKPPRGGCDDDDDDRQRRKKGKKKGGGAKTGDEYADEVRERRLKEFEYIWPTVFLVLGVGMAVVGAIGAGGPLGTLSVVLVIAGLFISIPIAIVTLMVVGAACGINYGRFGPAILKIAAVTFIVNGVYFIAEWLNIPPYFAGAVGCAAAFGLFKTMFDLDNGETNTSMGAINVVSFVLKWLVILVVAGILEKSEKGSAPSDGSEPSESRGWGKGKAPPVMNPDDEPDDPDDDP